MALIDTAIRTIALKPMRRATGITAICRRGVAASHATGRDVDIAVEEFLEAAVMRFSFRSRCSKRLKGRYRPLNNSSNRCIGLI